MPLVVIAILLFVVGFALPKTEANMDMKRVKSTLEVVGVVFFFAGLIMSSFVSVHAGYRGILLQFGAVYGDLSEGPHFIVPLIQNVEMIEVRTQKETADAAAASKDLQIVQAKIAINYHVDPGAVGNLFKKVGTEFASRVIDPATQETVKAVMANYTAEELINKREEVKRHIDDELTQRLAAYNIIVEVNGVSLTNFDFSADFNKAIELKQVAQQTAEQQKYELQKAELEAQTVVAAAKGRASAAQIEAAAYNALGGSKVLAKAWIEKWDGKLPTVAGSQGLMIDIASLMSGADNQILPPKVVRR